MVSRFMALVWPLALAISLTALSGCAGSKSSSASSDMAAATTNEKLEEARRSAEDAESKAHQLREEKNRNTAKSGN